MTAADRWLGHVGGTVGEDDVARCLGAAVTSGWWPLGRVGEGPAGLRAAGDDPADWRIASDTENFRKTHEFYVTSASVLDMPRLGVPLRLCRVSYVGRWVALRLRRRLSICQEVTCHFTARGKHERRNRWCLMTAVLWSCSDRAGAGGDRIPGARFPTPVRLDLDPCRPGKSQDIVNVPASGRPLAPNSFGGYR
jgi:hypothetical protein